MDAKYKSLSDAAQKQHAEAFEHLLQALRRYRHPLPALSTYHHKEARMMSQFLEVLLDQLYPREVWEQVLKEMA